MTTGYLSSMVAELLAALPEVSERHGSKQPDDFSFTPFQLRDYFNLDDGCKLAVTKIHSDEQDDEHEQIISNNQETIHPSGGPKVQSWVHLFWSNAPRKFESKSDIYGIDGFLSSSKRKNSSTPTVILDSGAAMHITGNFDLLSDFARAQDLAYRARDGTDLHVAGIGAIILDKLRIPNVRYVPDLGPGSTIASVQQLASSGYLVMFCGGWCYVRGHGDGSLVGKGRMHHDDGLYHIEYLHVTAAADDIAVQSAAEG